MLKYTSSVLNLIDDPRTNHEDFNLKKYRNKAQIVYGRRPIIEALEQGQRFERIYLKDSLRGEFEIEVRTKCRKAGIPLKKVPQIKLDKLTRLKNHQGIVGMISLIEYQEIENVIPFLFEQGHAPLILVLDNVQDIRNIGALARNCEAFGAHAIVLSGKNAGIINEDAIKSSAGALLRLPVCREKNVIDLIGKFQNMGLSVYGTSSYATKNIHEVEIERPLAVILGSEGQGIHRDTEEACDHVVKIPFIGSTESLNVSVAGGIILYEVMRQMNN